VIESGVEFEVFDELSAFDVDAEMTGQSVHQVDVARSGDWQALVCFLSRKKNLAFLQYFLTQKDS